MTDEHVAADKLMNLTIEVRDLQREYDALPERIAKLAAEQAEINQQLNSGQLYAADAARAAQLSARHAEIEGEWLQAMERWEALGGS